MLFFSTNNIILCLSVFYCFLTPRCCFLLEFGFDGLAFCLYFFRLTFYSGLLPFLLSATSDKDSVKFCVTLRWITWKKKRVLKVLTKVYFGPKLIFYLKHSHNSKDEAVLSQNTLETMTVVESFDVVQKKGSFFWGGGWGSGYHVKD